MTAGTSLRPREDARGRADAPNFLGDGARERSSQMTSTPIALSRAFWGVGVGAGREILARAGKGPIAKYEKENPGDLSATYPTDVKLSPFHFTPRKGLQVSPASIGLQSRTVLPLPPHLPPEDNKKRTISGCDTGRRSREGLCLGEGLYGTSVRPALQPARAAGGGHGVRGLGAAARDLRGLQAPGAALEAPAGHRGDAASKG